MQSNIKQSFSVSIICLSLSGALSSEPPTVETSPATSSKSTPLVSAPTTMTQRTQLVDTGKRRVLLLVRAKLSWVWHNTGRALEGIGFIVDDKDRRTGVYDIFYPAGGIVNGPSNKQDRTWLERVGLTTGDAQTDHHHYRIKLKKDDAGMILMTVQDHDGNGDNSDVAVHILTQLQKQLNMSSYSDKSTGDRLWGLLPDASSSAPPKVARSPATSSKSIPLVSESATTTQRTRLVDVGRGKMLLLVRAKLSWAWRNTGPALKEIGLIVDDKDRRTGTYDIFYPAAGIAKGQAVKQDRTLLERIGFTSGEAMTNHQHYQIKLKKDDAGRILITVQDQEGNWQNSEIAAHILVQLQQQLNTASFTDDSLWAWFKS